MGGAFPLYYTLPKKKPWQSRLTFLKDFSFPSLSAACRHENHEVYPYSTECQAARVFVLGIILLEFRIP